MPIAAKNQWALSFHQLSSGLVQSSLLGSYLGLTLWPLITMTSHWPKLSCQSTIDLPWSLTIMVFGVFMNIKDSYLRNPSANKFQGESESLKFTWLRSRGYMGTVILVTLWCWGLTVGDNFRMLATELGKNSLTSFEFWCPTLMLRDRGCWWPK